MLNKGIFLIMVLNTFKNRFDSFEHLIGGLCRICFQVNSYYGAIYFIIDSIPRHSDIWETN